MLEERGLLEKYLYLRTHIKINKKKNLLKEIQSHFIPKEELEESPLKPTNNSR